MRRFLTFVLFLAIVLSINGDSVFRRRAMLAQKITVLEEEGDYCNVWSQEVSGTTDFFLRSGSASANTYDAVHYWASNSLPVCRAELALRKTGTPTFNVYVSIWTHGGDNKPATMIDESDAVSVTSIGGTVSFVSFPSGLNAAQTADTQYWLVIRADSFVDTSHCLEWDGNTFIGPYPGFQTILSSSDGSTWSNQGNGSRTFFKLFTSGSGLDSSLFGFWDLDESSGTRADSSGQGSTLTDNSTVTSGTGKISNAGQFTRVNSEYLSHSDSDELSTGDISFTVCAWVNPDSLPGNMPIIQKGWDDAYGEFLLYYNDGIGDYQFNMANSGSIFVETSGVTPTIGRWDFICAGYDANLNELFISFNGGAKITASHSGGNSTTTGNFKIGTAFGAYWDGRIDEVGFWKKALSDAEIMEAYNNSSGKTCCPF